MEADGGSGRIIGVPVRLRGYGGAIAKRDTFSLHVCHSLLPTCRSDAKRRRWQKRRLRAIV